MPSLYRLQEMYSGRPFKLLLVNVLESRDTVEKFIKAEGYDFTVLLDEFGRASQFYEVRSHPTTYVILPSGNIAGFSIGYREWDSAAMVAIMDKFIAQDVPAKAKE